MAAALGVWWVSMAGARVVVPDPQYGGTADCGSAVNVAWLRHGGYTGGEFRDEQAAFDRSCVVEAEELLEFLWVPAFPAAAALLGAGMLLWPRRPVADVVAPRVA